jgi:ribonuclease HII
MNALFLFDSKLRKAYPLIAGIDEAGRGPLAGPVVAAAVVFKENIEIPNVRDSKEIPERERERLFFEILARCFDIGVGVSDHGTIDAINIFQATKQAMKHAVEDLTHRPDLLLIDSVRLPELLFSQRSMDKGESASASIAAASIIAKVTRDRFMKSYHYKYPQYNFIKHKGYPTKEHRENIQKYGPCEIHRKTFKGVKEWL